jgi:hypothetical protein
VHDSKNVEQTVHDPHLKHMNKSPKKSIIPRLKFEVLTKQVKTPNARNHYQIKNGRKKIYTPVFSLDARLISCHQAQDADAQDEIAAYISGAPVSSPEVSVIRPKTKTGLLKEFSRKYKNFTLLKLVNIQNEFQIVF